MNTGLLSDLPVDMDAEVVNIQGGRNMHDRLTAMGIGQGKKLRKISKVGFGGPVIVEVNRTQVAIGRGMAGKILVRGLKDG